MMDFVDLWQKLVLLGVGLSVLGCGGKEERSAGGAGTDSGIGSESSIGRVPVSTVCQL
jgi:hypothetical protein